MYTNIGVHIRYQTITELADTRCNVNLPHQTVHTAQSPSAFPSINSYKSSMRRSRSHREMPSTPIPQCDLSACLIAVVAKRVAHFEHCTKCQSTLLNPPPTTPRHPSGRRRAVAPFQPRQLHSYCCRPPMAAEAQTRCTAYSSGCPHAGF